MTKNKKEGMRIKAALWVTLTVLLLLSARAHNVRVSPGLPKGPTLPLKILSYMLRVMQQRLSSQCTLS